MAFMNRPRADLHSPWRCVLLILATLIFVIMSILGSSTVTIAQPGDCVKGDPDGIDPNCVEPPAPRPQPPVPQPRPQPPAPQPPAPQPRPQAALQPQSENPSQTKDSNSAGLALPLLLLFGLAAAGGVTWGVRRRFRASVRVSDVQLQERQPEGGQTEEEQRRTSETELVEVELELDVETLPEATVRVSGTRSVQYSGSYGSIQGRQHLVEVRTLGAEPVDYPVELQSEFDMVSATFRKKSPGTGVLKVEILSDSRVQEVQETTAAFGGVTISWKA